MVWVALLDWGASRPNQPIKKIVMNKKQKEKIIEDNECLKRVCRSIVNIIEDEREKLDRLPESLKDSEMAFAIDEGIYLLEDAQASIEEAIVTLLDVVQ